MKNIRVGDKVYHIYHMSNRGLVTEVYQVPVKHGNGAGSFSKMRRVKFISELDGKEYDLKISDVVKDN
tara:strand:- start:680 stop:883 length:204 start_codon:yes stop_codon:yes gene_type:complete